MQDPMAMGSAIMALRAQAEAWIASTNAAMAQAGHGFTDEDRAAIEASRTAHPYPEGYGPGHESTPADQAAAQDMAKRAMEAVYPPNGFEPADPRLEPVEGLTLALVALGAKAIGWSTEEAHIDRVVGALGLDRAMWDRASKVLSDRVKGDVVLGAFYGQLFTFA